MTKTTKTTKDVNEKVIKEDPTNEVVRDALDGKPPEQTTIVSSTGLDGAPEEVLLETGDEVPPGDTLAKQPDSGVVVTSDASPEVLAQRPSDGLPAAVIKPDTQPTAVAARELEQKQERELSEKTKAEIELGRSRIGDYKKD